MSTRLPVGFTVGLDRRTRRLDGGAVLLGGSPVRLMFLAPAARRLLAGDTLTVRDATGAALARRLLDAGLANPVFAAAPLGAGHRHTYQSRDGVPHSSGAVAVVGGPGREAVTVVVPVRDRADGLRRLLAALAATAPGLAAVIVVDDGSRDGAGCRRIAEAGGAVLLRHDGARGPAAARNTGLAAAGTDYVAFLDSDVVPGKGWLEPLLAHLADPAVALAAPRIVGLPRPHPGWLTRYEGLRSALDLGPAPAPVLPLSRVAYVPSAALVVRRTAVGAGFDAAMEVAEDVDLGLRLHAAGWRLRYEPAARVAHEHRTGVADWWLRKAFYGTGAARLAGRHPGSVPPAVLAPWTAAVCLLVATRRPRALLAAVGVTAAATLRLRRTLRRLGGPGAVALRLVGRGLLGATAQCADLLARHWWPLTAVSCVVSRRARRAVLVAALAEGGHDWWTHRPEPGSTGLDPARYLLAHRLDDLGYGAGLWLGAWRARTLAPLLPVVTGRPGRGPRRDKHAGMPASMVHGPGDVACP